MPGSQPAEQQDFESKPIANRSISMSQAERIARELVPSGRLSSVTLPEPDKKESAYTIRFSDPSSTVRRVSLPLLNPECLGAAGFSRRSLVARGLVS